MMNLLEKLGLLIVGLMFLTLYIIVFTYILFLYYMNTYKKLVKFVEDNSESNTPVIKPCGNEEKIDVIHSVTTTDTVLPILDHSWLLYGGLIVVIGAGLVWYKWDIVEPYYQTIKPFLSSLTSFIGGNQEDSSESSDQGSVSSPNLTSNTTSTSKVEDSNSIPFKSSSSIFYRTPK